MMQQIIAARRDRPPRPPIRPLTPAEYDTVLAARMAAEAQDVMARAKAEGLYRSTWDSAERQREAMAKRPPTMCDHILAVLHPEAWLTHGAIRARLAPLGVFPQGNSLTDALRRLRSADLAERRETPAGPAFRRCGGDAEAAP